MADEIVKSQGFGQIESVLMTGDLSKLSSEQRVEYYNAVCKSTGINPLTRPFDYIQLNGKLTLYAKKDAADQLRKINDVSVDDVEITETSDTYFVKVKGHDKSGRTDVEIGVVKKSDMQGNAANAQMKAVTKAKRRLTLSICGLGWLDETEVETIKDARPVSVSSDGDIIDAQYSIGNQPSESEPQIEKPRPQPVAGNPEPREATIKIGNKTLRDHTPEELQAILDDPQKPGGMKTAVGHVLDWKLSQPEA